MSFDLLINRKVVQTLDFTGISQACFFSVNNNSNRSGLIGHLFLKRLPLAIARFVIAFIINPINRVFRRGRISHIFIKCLKAVSPAIAHFYSTTSIAIKEITFRIFSTINHAAPSNIDFGLTFPVRASSITNQLCLSASTISAFSRYQITGLRNRLLCSASAFADPLGFIAFIVFWMSRENDPKAECFAC